jgi:hypothetical protein
MESTRPDSRSPQPLVTVWAEGRGMEEGESGGTWGKALVGGSRRRMLYLPVVRNVRLRFIAPS